MATTQPPTTTLPTSSSLISTTSTTATCTTAVPGKHGYVPPEACNSNWAFSPSFEAAILFSVLFAILLLAHVFQAFWYKKRFTWVLIMGVTWEFASFITRALGSRKQQNQSFAVVSQLLLLLAPLWTNAFAYMTLGRLIHFFHPSKRILRVKGSSITKYFVWCDIISFLVQGAGGSMLSPGNDAQTQKNGLNVYMGGVGLQEFFIVVFTFLMVKFQVDMQRLEARGESRMDRTGWRACVYNMYAVLVLISTRIIFRLIEYSRGTDPSNPIPHHEAYMYALDALPMFLAILLLNIWHPGHYLVGPESEFPRLSRKEKKALKREKKERKREKKEMKKQGKKGRREGGRQGGGEVELQGDWERGEERMRY
ncbi:RTA1-domain-containing protein [Zopfia rhizophila CBS 207.26]|uniref:RTA1-domain-containing protein n=1 Tax=Zopfia rhizophila CBS 207.26 TaxID=1314779 RepID=A0A6A6DC89_9PEZI|nr:RTA1-domain-containing protein [Zopfia rhizophila CBS 207.26]